MLVTSDEQDDWVHTGACESGRLIISISNSLPGEDSADDDEIESTDPP